MTASAKGYGESAPSNGRGPSVMQAYVQGWRGVVGAPWLLIGTWLMTIALAAPLALALHGMVAEHLGNSLAAESAASGVNFDWWNEFLAQAAGVGQTFVPRIIGFAAVLGNLSRLADANGLVTIPAVAVGAHIVLSTFFAGGILDRLARGRAVGAAGFFSASGVFFFRFLRLGIIAGAAYWVLFTKVHPLLFDRLLSSWTKDVTVERTAFAYRVLLYIVFGALVVVVNLIVDYAKVRAVVEDRRSMVMALVAALRFVRRNVGATLGLYLLNLTVFLGVLFLYYVAAPGASGPMMWIALVVGQLFIVLRAAVRLQFAASAIALFQGRLAHAHYTATPTPTWPDSPAAEAIRI
jgi:hypothetical protein